MFLSLPLVLKCLACSPSTADGKFSQPSCAFISVATSRPAAEEYTVDIEISLENASFLAPIRAYLSSLSFPIQGNDTDPAANILSIEVTTGEWKTLCFRMEDWAHQEKGRLSSLQVKKSIPSRLVKRPNGPDMWFYDFIAFPMKSLLVNSAAGLLILNVTKYLFGGLFVWLLQSGSKIWPCQTTGFSSPRQSVDIESTGSGC